jgi:hypothetical protein
MAKSKVFVISGPMDAKHVGGVNVMGGKQPSMLDSYFDKPRLEPDELPRHTFAATGNIEVPRRSDTISGSILRPSLSLKSSFSKLRRSSVSHMSEAYRTNESTSKINTATDRSGSPESRRSPRPLRMQSSLSRLRQRVGLDKDLYVSPPASKPATPEPEAAPEPIQKDYPPLHVRKSFSRDTPYSSRAPEPERPVTNATMHRAPSVVSQKATTIHRRPEPERPATSAPMHRQPSFVSRNASTVRRRPSPTSHQTAVAPTVTTPARKPPSRPKRADSGTAIAFDNVPTLERPLPFQEIMAVQSLADRMAMYKRTRDYWAYADHGLIEWTGQASGQREHKLE